MDVKLINPFLESVSHVLSTMASLDCKPGRVALKKDSTAKGDVTGIIGMVGDKLTVPLPYRFLNPSY